MRSFSAAVPIRASKEQIWPILVDMAAYPEWNPVIERLEGEMQPGGHIKVFPKDPYQKRYEVVVEEVSAPKRMVWRRTMPLGTFAGTRTFILRNLKDGVVEFEMREIYTGWLASWLKRSLPDPQRSFEIFAVALKQRVERALAGEPQDGAQN